MSIIVLNGKIFSKGSPKVVCVGRNYADHAKEMNSAVPKEPILFIKPASSLAAFDSTLKIPQDLGSVHHELEIALLVGDNISKASPNQVLKKIAGLGLGIDLTLRDLQTSLKDKGHPWERAKAFDGSCWLSGFVSVDHLDIALGESNFEFTLLKNGQIQQTGRSEDMIFSMAELTAYISQFFTLDKGDVILTGTPSGVGPLKPGDNLSANLRLGSKELISCECTIG